MSTSETPRFLIPYPSDDAEEWWQTFRDGMNAIDAVMFRNMEANKLIMRDLPDVVVESDGVGGYQLRFISGDLTFISRTLETYIPVNTATPVPVYANGIIVCPIQAAATTPTAVDLECLLNGVEIDSSLIPIGYVRSDYTVIWYNGAQMEKDTITTMFAGLGGGGGGGGDRKPAVIDYVDCTAAPPTEVTGDRYILDASGAVHADWDGAAQNSIVEFTGAIWGSQTPSEGWVAYVDLKDADYRYIDDGVGQWEKIANTAADVTVDNSGWAGSPFESDTNVQESLETIIDEIALSVYDGTVQLLDSAFSPGMPATTQIDIGEIDKGTNITVQFSLTSGASTDTDLQFYDGDPGGSGVLLKEFLGLDLVASPLDDSSIWYVGLQTVGDLWVSVTNNTASDSVYSLRLRINAMAATNISVDNAGWSGNLGSETTVQAALDTLSARWPIYDDTTTFTDVAASGGESTVELDIGAIDDGICEAVQLTITAGTSADTTIQLYNGNPSGGGSIIYQASNLDLVTYALDDRNCWYVDLPTTGELWVKITNDGGTLSSYSLRLRVKGDV